jgi:DNA polymerase-3 subunit gamma/tau
MLEEPPEHAIFVLATTEKHKVLPTIISRCQSFDFRRPGVQVLSDKLAEIAAAEEIQAEPEALTIIARAGGGSFRDAEGLLDQLASFSKGKITATMVRDLLGSAGTEVLAEAVEALHERRTADALRIVDRISNEGRDLGQFTSELLEHLRRVMLFPHAPEVALAEVGESGEERDRLQAQADSMTTAEAVRFVDTLGASLGRAKRGGDPKLELELTFLRLTRDYSEPSVEALMARIESLESLLASGGAPTNGTPQSPRNPGAPPPAETSQPVPPEPESEEPPRASREPAEPPGDEEAPDPDSEPHAEPHAEPHVEPHLVEPNPAPPLQSEPHAQAPESQGSEELQEPKVTEEPKEPDVPETLETPATSGGSESLAGGEGAERVASQWPAVIQELKRNRQALTAAVYEEAHVTEFDGSVLKLAFPQEQSFYVGMANDRKHADELGKVLEGRLGSRPRLEITVYDGGEPPFASRGPVQIPDAAEEPPLEDPESHRPRDEPPAARPEAQSAPSPPDEDIQNEARHEGSAESQPASRAEQRPGGGEPDDIIRDPREVVEMARQRFGNFGSSGGTGR